MSVVEILRNPGLDWSCVTVILNWFWLDRILHMGVSSQLKNMHLSSSLPSPSKVNSSINNTPAKNISIYIQDSNISWSLHFVFKIFFLWYQLHRFLLLCGSVVELFSIVYLPILAICLFLYCTSILPPWAFQVVLVVKNPVANAGDIRDAGLIPQSRGYPGGRHDNPLEYITWKIPWTE